MLCHLTLGRSFNVSVRRSGENSQDSAMSPFILLRPRSGYLRGSAVIKRPQTVSYTGPKAAMLVTGLKFGASPLMLRFRTPPRLAWFDVSFGLATRPETSVF